MTTLLFLSAFALSSIAAYYAIMGLMAIFSGAAMSIAIMGAALEVSKIVVSSWLYRNWKETSLLLKSYFIIAIIVLMCLTSMGIFGYLSKAHSDQGLVTGDVLSKIEIIDSKIKYQREIINDNRSTLDQLDQQIAKYTELGAVSRGVKVRDAQRSERTAAYAAIEAAQGEIGKLTTEKIPLAQEARKVEAEVGPIRYIAALIYGEQTDASFLDKAVRIVILMIVGVFDPLAVLMFIAVNQSAMRKEKDSTINLEESTETTPVWDDFFDNPSEKVEEPVEASKDVVTKNASTGGHIITKNRINLRDSFKIEKI